MLERLNTLLLLGIFAVVVWTALQMRSVSQVGRFVEREPGSAVSSVFDTATGKTFLFGAGKRSVILVTDPIRGTIKIEGVQDPITIPAEFSQEPANDQEANE